MSMLLSLISVLALLVVGFYAFWLAFVGRVANEGPELSIVGRAVVLGIGVLALGIAYWVYSNPKAGSFSELASVPQAMSSNPPESRGSEPAAVPPEAPPEAVAAVEETPASASSQAEPNAEPKVEPKAEEVPTPVAKAAEPEQPVESESNGLSAAAARLEAEALRPRRAAMAATEPVAEPAERESMPTTVVVAQKRVAAEPLPRSKSTRSASITRSTSTNRRGQPLLLHVHNSLGRDQAREQLTLSIEGLAVADIEVDGSRPSVAVAVPLPRPGLLHYRLEGVSEEDGTTVLRGEGCIRVKDGARFAVRRQAGSRKVFLEQQASRGRAAG